MILREFAPSPLKKKRRKEKKKQVNFVVKLFASESIYTRGKNYRGELIRHDSATFFLIMNL